VLQYVFSEMVKKSKNECNKPGCFPFKMEITRALFQMFFLKI
jgi:hypothetical protein